MGGSGLSAVANGVVFSAAGNTLYAFDAAGNANCSGSPKTCTPLWSAVPWEGGGNISSIAVGRQRVVYVASDDHNIYAFDAGLKLDCSGSPKTCTPLSGVQTGGTVTSIAIDGALFASYLMTTGYAFGLRDYFGSWPDAATIGDQLASWRKSASVTFGSATSWNFLLGTTCTPFGVEDLTGMTEEQLMEVATSRTTTSLVDGSTLRTRTVCTSCPPRAEALYAFGRPKGRHRHPTVTTTRKSSTGGGACVMVVRIQTTG